MGEVVEVKFSSEPSYQSGKAKCISCNLHWQGSAPIGHTVLECPDCKTMTGCWFGISHVSAGEKFFQCNCGNDLFVITTESFMCAKCGVEHNQ